MHAQRTDRVQPKPVDLRETRRRFLLAREQVSQSSTERYHAVRKLRDWPMPERER